MKVQYVCSYEEWVLVFNNRATQMTALDGLDSLRNQPELSAAEQDVLRQVDKRIELDDGTQPIAEFWVYDGAELELLEKGLKRRASLPRGPSTGWIERLQRGNAARLIGKIAQATAIKSQ